MAEDRKLRDLYDNQLSRGPFPINECGGAQIQGKLHGELTMYLADIAGLASRGERGLELASAKEKTKWRHFASRSLAERCPEISEKITPTATPKLHALQQATEQARIKILKAIDL